MSHCRPYFAWSCEIPVFLSSFCLIIGMFTFVYGRLPKMHYIEALLRLPLATSNMGKWTGKAYRKRLKRMKIILNPWIRLTNMPVILLCIGKCSFLIRLYLKSTYSTYFLSWFFFSFFFSKHTQKYLLRSLTVLTIAQGINRTTSRLIKLA